MAGASTTSTGLFLLGIALSYLLLPNDSASSMFFAAAVGIGLSLVAATAFDSRAGMRALLRVDILMLWVLYGLTFLEFLFPTQSIDSLLSPEVATRGVYAALLGFAGIAVGRHIVSGQRRGNTFGFFDLASRHVFTLFLLAATVGYIHILWSVNFDLIEMLRQMALPRFSQSWGRGKFGDAYALLVELGALLYLVPPVAGLIYARNKEYSAIQLGAVTVVLMLTVYYAFSSGTRNVIVVYLITFMGAYWLNRPEIKLWRAIAQGAGLLLLLLIVTSYMLAFRNVGIRDFDFAEGPGENLYIDRNMVVLSYVTNAFPTLYDYLGLEVLFNALIRPIPRALWPGKPEGLSVSIESVMGVDQATLASTFIGEAYIMAGMIGVLLVAMFFGAVATIWNRVGLTDNSSFAKLLYASGFFCAAISMRSMLWTTVTMLPTIALWLYGKMWQRQRDDRRRIVAK